MIRSVLLGIATLALATPVFAAEFAPAPGGYIEFTMPSNNIGCVYRDEEGTGLVLECDRVQPSYLRVRLFEEGKPRIYRQVGDPSCCGAMNYLDYGNSWRKGPFSCSSTTSGLRCNNGEHGFRLSRGGVKTY